MVSKLDYIGSATLPRAQARGVDASATTEKVTAATSSTSLYDNVSAGTTTTGKRGTAAGAGSTAASTSTTSATTATTTDTTSYVSMRQTRDRGTQPREDVGSGGKAQVNHVGVGSQTQQSGAPDGAVRGTGVGGGDTGGSGQRQGQSQGQRAGVRKEGSSLKNSEYSDGEAEVRKRAKSKSTDDVTGQPGGQQGPGQQQPGISLDSNTLKRMLKPMPSLASSVGGESPATSPETGRRRGGGGGPCLHPSHHHPMHTQQQHHQPHHQQHLHPQHMLHLQQQQHQQQMSMHHGYGYHTQHPHQGHPMQHHMSQQQHHLGHHSHHHPHHGHHHSREDEDEMDDANDISASYLSEPEAGGGRRSRFSASRSAHEIGRSANGGGGYGRGLYLELERGGGQGGVVGGGGGGSASPPSDNVLFDHACYATTPSSSNGNNSDLEMAPGNTAGGAGVPTTTPTPGSPTSRLLLEYELHLRNTLAKGMDAESYSLHTFEALLSQSMENLVSSEETPKASYFGEEVGETGLSKWKKRRPRHPRNIQRTGSERLQRSLDEIHRKYRGSLSYVRYEAMSYALNSPSFKFSRKASSSYSLKLDPPGKQKGTAATGQTATGTKATRRKPVSTPASPSRAAAAAAAAAAHREPQCTCMTPEQYARLRAQDPRYREFAENLPGSAPRSPHPTRRRPGSSASMNKSSTLPLPHRLPQQSSVSSVGGDRPSSVRDRDGYYSDRNELIRERERDRATASGYLSDHNSRCASCHGGEFAGSSASLAARTHFQQGGSGWSRHSDGWRGDRGSATTGASTMSVASAGRGRGEGRSSHRSPWDSLPSLRHEGGDGSHYRADSFDRSLLHNLYIIMNIKSIKLKSVI
ncbi:hypothetical protein J437_LFUL013227 [Ladona fulva]|uniref:Uncharacterized protein n=1 Tax=Ladona fulva TaxID=123851 RepID=A0A8K0KF83_LADFU|nr:hypothetical protein J437_LFUL013227 [Ladona fulva]